MKKSLQTSDSIKLGIILALAGGFMDAYSYIQRGKVFANAQTGNILLFGIHIYEGHLSDAFRYFIPVFSFVIGIILAEFIHKIQNERFHWRQVSILIEAFILFIVSFISLDLNLIANSLTSLACGMQLQTFRKIHGENIATTMCIGNLRSATQHLCTYIDTKNKSYLQKSCLYFGIIFFFVVGAILGHLFISTIHQYALMICSCILLVGFILMFHNKENNG